MKENIKYSFLNRIVNTLTPFVISMYLARVLDKNDLGNIAYGKNILTYFLVIAMMGIQEYGIREIAKARNNTKKESKIFCELFVINTVSTMGSLLLYALIKSIYPDQIIGIFIIVILANFFNFDYLLLGRENYKFVALRNIIQKILSLLLILIFVQTSKHVNRYIIIYALSQFVLHIPDIIYAIKVLEIPASRLDIIKHCKSILFLFGTAISLELYSQIDITMLGAWCTYSDVALYSYSSKFIKMIVVLICSISTVLLPRISYLRDKEEISENVKWILKLVLILAIPAMIGGYIVSYDIMTFLYGESFYEAGRIVRVLSLLIVICSLGNIFGTQVLISQNNETKLLISTLVGACTNIVFNFILIRKNGIEGAAIASLVSEFLVMLLQVFYSRKLVSFKIEMSFWIGLIVSTIVLLLSMIPFILYEWDNKYTKLIVQIVVGFCIYGISIKLLLLDKLFKRRD
ncbi:flippase [Butyrivibrio fibrisolvens]|uniref:flippase n=1 Tax=Butyrivibrio fibrisolvens TaxID=831 RepID=UPI00042A0E0B|nr:flippase [Butyrivibrio fibrisolvens]